MKVFDKEGRELEVTLYGKYEDDIQIDEIYYTDSDEEVSDSVIEYIYDKYSDKMYEEWFMDRCSDGESFYEGLFD